MHQASASLSDNVWPGGGGLTQQACDGQLPVQGGAEVPVLLQCPAYDELVLQIDPVPVEYPPLIEAL